MADKRINALTTTSASVGDDYFAIDGATNGTRALSAFSPTFGGNATVTGTLSSGGNLSVTGTSAQVILGQSSGSQLTYLIRPAQAGGAIQMVQDSATANRWLSLGISDNVGVYSELMRVAGVTGNILIPGTVASTTTSTGALVVGNGTSGGLGVGGAINCGGLLYARGTGVNYFVADTDTRLEVGNSIIDQRAHIGIVQRLNLGNAIFSKNLQGQSATDNYTTIGTTVSSGYSGVECGYGGIIRLLTGTGATTAGAVVTPTTSLLASTTQISIPLSTASTSTSSGALVVSGGVGVAGAGFFGGNIVAAGNVVCGSATNQAVSIAGGTANDGGNIIVYGSTHASDPNTGRIRVGTTTITSWDSNDFTIASGKGLKVGNAYVAGAPTATGYIVIKDSTGTSYKIPAVAL